MIFNNCMKKVIGYFFLKLHTNYKKKIKLSIFELVVICYYNENKNLKK